MSTDAVRVKLTERFPPAQLRAVALAYRAKMGEGHGDVEASGAARAAYLAHGGDPSAAAKEAAWMIATISVQHSEWFWRPCRRYHERAEAALRFTCQWPGPLAAEDRRQMIVRAMANMEAAGAGPQLTD